MKKRLISVTLQDRPESYVGFEVLIDKNENIIEVSHLGRTITNLLSPETIKDIRQMIKNNRIEGYIELGNIMDSDHKLLGCTADAVKKMIDIVSSPKYAYSRQQKYGIAIYHHDYKSPTGVLNVGGIPNEFEFLIYQFRKGGPLSPTEDLRTAH